MRILPTFLGVLLAGNAAAQNVYQPPEGETGTTGSFQLGLFGFSTRVGVDFEGQGQAVGSFTLDLGNLYTDRLRLRPSGELGFGWADNTYVGNIEAVYRFTADSVVAVPYVGGGIAVSGQEGCGLVDDCPRVWAQFMLGFELRLRDQINWLLEYHAEDAFRRHRIFVGLTTRRGT